jgi:amidase
MSFPTAIEIAARVRAGEVTAVETVAASLARIDALDGEIGAFQLVDRVGAERAARELDARADRARLPLAGVPVAIKDNVDVAGLPTRYGSGASATDPVPADDELVRRLREAGAIVVGKTRLPELAIWGFTESVALGGTRNPRRRSHNAGGSTGGGAAAVAAGMVPLSLGSDGGGSLRIPAANCGVVGIKPANATVPLAGGLAEHWFGCSANGPIAATVADAILALDVLAGTDTWRGADVAGGRGAEAAGGRGADADAGTGAGGDAGVGGLRVAVSVRSPSPIGRADATARAAIRAATAAAQAAGHQVGRAEPPYPRSLASTWVGLWLTGIAEEVERLALPLDRLEPRTAAMVAKGRRLRGRGEPEAGRIGKARQRWRDTARRWFERYDVLMSPVIARPAPPAGWGTRASYLRAYLNGARSTPYTQAWNVAGFPALSLPFGGTASCPGAVQLVAAPGREGALLVLAAELEAAAGRLR